MENQTVYSVRNEFKTIPFVDIILPYTEGFLNGLEKVNTSVVLIDKLHLSLLKELSSVAEITLQEELNHFRNNGQDSYPEFIEIVHSLLSVKYPVLDKMLISIANNYLLHIQNIFSNFSKDIDLIVKTFSLAVNENNPIEDIDTSFGDGHNGESTALVILSDGTKLIYKPRNIDVAISYNLFIGWVNDKLNTTLKTLSCVSNENYGWLEFVPYKAVNSTEELEEYYYKSGILLAVTFLLGSKDYHYENIIASGSNPVIIDHETIIQPMLSNQSIRTWDDQHKIPRFSVLESMLIVNQHSGAALQYAGFGIKGNTEVMDLEMQTINPNTMASKRDSRFIFRKLIKENVPVYNDDHMFANTFKDVFIEGFSAAYDMFINSREELLSDRSPIQFFENQDVRYIWRPTFIYFKILKYMRGASFMQSFDTYKIKLYELMSKAYKKEGLENFKFILESEMKQMLNGDIPFFNLNSKDDNLEDNKSVRIFEYSCIDNIKQRIDLLSDHHKNKQIQYITNWLDISI